MVTPDSEPLNALEVVKLTVSLRSLTPPLSQICLFTGISVPCPCSQMHARDPLQISRSHQPDPSIPVIPQLFTRSVFVARRDSSVSLFCNVNNGNKADIGSLFFILSVFISFTFSYDVFQAFFHLKQYLLSFFLLCTPVSAIREVHALNK